VFFFLHISCSVHGITGRCRELFYEVIITSLCLSCIFFFSNFLFKVEYLSTNVNFLLVLSGFSIGAAIGAIATRVWLRRSHGHDAEEVDSLTGLAWVKEEAENEGNCEVSRSVCFGYGQYQAYRSHPPLQSSGQSYARHQDNKTKK